MVGHAQCVIGLIRVLDDALDHKFGQTIEPNIPINIFMMNCAVNRFSLDPGDRTPMKQARGPNANREVAEFGEIILFQPMARCNKTSTLDVRWHQGLFLGVATRTKRNHGEWSERQ